MILYILLSAFVLFIGTIGIGLYASDDLDGFVGLLQTGIRKMTRKTVYLVAVYAVILAILIYVFVGWILIIDFNPIGIPNWLIPYWILTAIPGPLAMILAFISLKYLDSSTGRILHCRQPIEGDWAVKELDERRWKTADVLQIVKNEDGKKGVLPKRKTDLNVTSALAKKGLFSTKEEYVKTYECLRYDERYNIIFVSDIVGMTNDELTSWQDSIEYAQTVLQYKAAKQAKLESEFAQRVDSATQRKTNYIIHTIADASLGDDAIRNELKKTVQAVGIDYLPQNNEEIADELGLDKPTDEDMNFREIAEYDGVIDAGDEQ